MGKAGEGDRRYSQTRTRRSEIMSLRKRALKSLEQDIRDHIERETQDNIDRGMPADEARRAAYLKFGNVARIQEETRAVWRHVWLEQLIQDVRYALRTLRRNPVFTLTAITTLAIGIGATTAIFSTVNATILRPLPFAQPDELVDVRTRFVDGRVTTGFVSPVELVALNNLSSVVARASAVNYQPFDATLIRNDGTSVNVMINSVAEGFFEVLGLPMSR